jgi:maltooligosyltrehalose trehalohydrolase
MSVLTVATHEGFTTQELGAVPLPDGSCAFRVWAPHATQLSVELQDGKAGPLPLIRGEHGYWSGLARGVGPGVSYKYRIDENRSFPDPASRSQPSGVHGPSEVVSQAFAWSDAAWHGRSIEDYVLYEVHIGTFTQAGTFDSAVAELGRLRDLGITAVEVMPVAQFPGSRNWGYDGVFPFAVQNSYGGLEGFKRFVDAAHRLGLAVVLDVVYNHLGPEGNYLSQFGPYFTDRYQTPWGQAVNFDGADSGGVRDYFVRNALCWVRDFHIDGLRLDAVHAIFDASPTHILTEIASAVHDFGRDHERTIAVIAESDLNEARLVRKGELGGYGLDAQWSDDFHHAVHTVLTGEQLGYYEDFGRVQDIAKALSSGFVYSGQYSKHRGQCHGTDCTDIPGRAFVVCVQNHDQIGNRMMGERLSHLVALEHLKMAAGLLLLSPFVPLLFMGQEYAETAPFLYFVSHSDPALVEAVREGRKREFETFAWQGAVPDAQDDETFQRCKLNSDLTRSGWHAVLYRWYETLLRMRREFPALATLNRDAAAVDVAADGRTLVLRRWHEEQEVLAFFRLADTPAAAEVPAPHARWDKVLDSAESKWMGPGSELSLRVRAREGRLYLDLGPNQCAVLVSQPSTA